MAGESETGRRTLAKVLRGMDDAFQKSAEAGQGSIRRLVETGRGMSERELKQAFEGVQKAEEQLIAALGRFTESAGERLPSAQSELARRTARASTESTRQAAAVVTELTARLAGTSIELGLTGMELAAETGVRCAQIAGSWLAGIADALERVPAEEAKKSR